ncbi:GNAT family N-acetyltransferase [Blastococcus sp. TF02-8]|uniref:GNAT family N-acetyltransferase n=1 Tax=Blastococcus sp. TF02-8 TaxID=2250574 RepID=UPI000DE80327|nr:GNAT family N-acetyltransferase [Blastococcus sp. TF02-8]RBY95549.1 GNAT family N-acetyltransferase [Blastococcus sp. TF02-8]
MGQMRSSLDVVGLERLAARGWRAPEEDHLGEWLLRAAQGFTSRANSALVAGDPGRPLPEAVAAVERWYDERGLRPCALLPGVQSRPADAAFATAGWQRDEPVLVLTAPVTGFPPPPVPIDLRPAPDASWLARYRPGGAPLPPGALEVLTRGEELVFASARPGPTSAEPVAIARGALVDGRLGVTALDVDERYRRQGLATAVMGALVHWAAARGAHEVYLQVTAGNTAARALYRRAGFIEHHRYHYRRRP